MTTDDLAEEFGVTHQALSERLRRGQGELRDHAFVENAGTPDYPVRLMIDEDAVVE
ncbi:helix-turn-helix domain-containing protein [Haladaptatus sp. AB643]|uniref:helix-turn-helix domain-containing protein n=1 Tax=unclassified Haladaptatus TaxID=2622732 RepID=UPI00209BF9A1|nr:helix-turn-helix domain-containing protein [Haladaptatus sp. AB643]MCO8253610.1 helix-turn-helix domain-containing protein [Haladaptatus sp. AB618]